MPLGKPRPFVFTAANRIEVVADENPARKEFFAQNQGPGVFGASPQEFRDLTEVQNIQVNGHIKDTDHKGKWYAMASVANTRIVISETT